MNTQRKLDKVRPPRVQITYDVELGGAVEKKRIAFGYWRYWAIC